MDPVPGAHARGHQRAARPRQLRGRDRLGHAATTAPATSPCATRCPASPSRWSTGGSPGTRSRPCATGSGIRRATSASRVDEWARRGSSTRRCPCATSSENVIHHVTEDVGMGAEHIDIHFLTPEEMGFDMSRWHGAQRGHLRRRLRLEPQRAPAAGDAAGAGHHVPLHPRDGRRRRVAHALLDGLHDPERPARAAAAAGRPRPGGGALRPRQPQRLRVRAPQGAAAADLRGARRVA